jgi:cell division protein FtsA
MPVRVGAPGTRLAGLADSVRRPKFATAVGLALHAADTGRAADGGPVGRVLSWIREFF